MKVDLAMWAKNGSKFLPSVLKRIDEVIPNECVNKRVFVDDRSTDNSVQIAKDFNWNVYPNIEGYTRGGFIEALNHVNEEFFVSVEQDVLLSRDWWDRISKHMENENIAVAQGIRLMSTPAYRAVQDYTLATNPRLLATPTLDNNFWRTSIAKRTVVPRRCLYGVDDELYHQINTMGYKWIIDYKVCSTHLKPNLWQIKWGDSLKETYVHHTYELGYVSFWRMLRIFAFSPIRSFYIVRYTRNPMVFLAYPFIRMMGVKSIIIRRATLNAIKPDERLEPSWSSIR